MIKDKVRVAVVGLGKMGILHASILNVLPNVQLTALCDKSKLMLRVFKKILNRVSIVDDVEKLCSQDIDAVYVTTPIFSHFTIAKKVYLQKIARNLFVEKTLAANFNEASELCDIAQSFGGTNMVGYMKRFAVTFRKAKDILTQKTLGEPVSFEAYAYSSDFLLSEKNSKTSLSRGGTLRDLGCHAVDLALWFFGDLQVDSVDTQQKIDKASQNSVHFSVKKSNGLYGHFNVSQCMEKYRMPEIGLAVRCSDGNMSVTDDKLSMEQNDGTSFTWYTHDLDDNVKYWLGATEYYREDAYFVKSALEGLVVEPSFLTASKVDYLIEQVRFRVDKNE